MMKVATGLQTGATIAEKYPGSRKKKVFLFMPSGTSATCTTSTTPSFTTTSTSTLPTQTFTTTSTSTLPTPSFTTTSTSTLPTPSFTTTSTSRSTLPTQTFTTTSTLPTQTFTTTSTSTLPTQTFTTTSTSTLPTLTFTTTTSTSAPMSARQQVPVIDLNTPPTDGASTRRYLAAIANSGDSDDDNSDSEAIIDASLINISDSEDDEERTRQPNIPRPTTRPVSTLTGLMDNEREPICYGYVTDDFTTAGVATDEDVTSRTTEVLKCIEALENGGQIATLPFLTHTFEEFIWQGTEDTRVMVAVLVPLNSDQEKLKKLITMLHKTVSPDCYLWIANFASVEAEKVKLKYGLQQPVCTVLVLAPSHSRNVPQCVEIFDESNMEEERLLEAIGTSSEFCSAQKDERKKLETWRMERQEQDREFKQCEEQKDHGNEDVDDQGNGHNEPVNVDTCKEQDKKDGGSKEEGDNEKEIREEPRDGKTIWLRTSHGRIGRKFKNGAYFQEVYDWAGTNEELPLHFTIHRGNEMVNHDQVVQEDEVLNLTEREEVEGPSLLNTEVSFRGNFYNKESTLSATLVDEHHLGINEDDAAEDKEEEQNIQQENNPDDKETKKKRKRKNNRSTAARKKKKNQT